MFNFLYEEGLQNNFLVGLREEPMGKNDIKVLKNLCNELKIDIF
jgi:hypothetical protein